MARIAEENRQNIETDEDRLLQAIEDANKALEGKNTRLRLYVHKETGRVAAKIVDQDTQEVVKYIPPEEILTLAARIDEMIGIILDEKG